MKEELSNTTKKRQWSFIGHELRRDGELIEAEMAEVTGKRRTKIKDVTLDDE